MNEHAAFEHVRPDGLDHKNLPKPKQPVNSTGKPAGFAGETPKECKPEAKGTNETAGTNGGGAAAAKVVLLIFFALLSGFSALAQFSTNRPGTISPAPAFGAGGVGTVTNSPGFNTNPPAATPAPVSLWGGTNNPNGVITSGYGSLYMQFDAATGTNLLQQWVKQSATGNTNWIAAATGTTNLALMAGQLASIANLPPGAITNLTVPALGGTNDDTGIFNTYFNSQKPVVCPVGDFNISHILITNDNEAISGYGCRLHMLTNLQGYAVCARGMTNISLKGLSVYGGIHQPPGWTFTNNVVPPASMSEYGWATIPIFNQTPTNARSGFYLPMFGWSAFEDLKADGFNVAGFYLSNTNTQYSHSTPIATFKNPGWDWCYIGVELPGLHVCDFTTNNTYLYYDGGGQIPGWGDPQYTVINSPVGHDSTFGIVEGAWNVAINNPQISDSFIGIYLSGNVHGVISGGNLNHNSGVSYYISGVSAGEVISGQQLRGGDGLYISGNNAGVTFNGCMFDAASILVITNNTGATIFNNCSWQDAFAFTLDNTGIGVITNGCYSELTLTNQAQMNWVGSVRIPTNTACPAPVSGQAILWNSNGASYWVTTAHTNYVTGP